MAAVRFPALLPGPDYSVRSVKGARPERKRTRQRRPESTWRRLSWHCWAGTGFPKGPPPSQMLSYLEMGCRLRERTLSLQVARGSLSARRTPLQGLALGPCSWALQPTLAGYPAWIGSFENAFFLETFSLLVIPSKDTLHSAWLGSGGLSPSTPQSHLEYNLGCLPAVARLFLPCMKFLTPLR